MKPIFVWNKTLYDASTVKIIINRKEMLSNRLKPKPQNFEPSLIKNDCSEIAPFQSISH